MKLAVITEMSRNSPSLLRSQSRASKLRQTQGDGPPSSAIRLPSLRNLPSNELESTSEVLLVYNDLAGDDWRRVIRILTSHETFSRLVHFRRGTKKKERKKIPTGGKHFAFHTCGISAMAAQR